MIKRINDVFGILEDGESIVSMVKHNDSIFVATTQSVFVYKDGVLQIINFSFIDNKT